MGLGQLSQQTGIHIQWEAMDLIESRIQVAVLSLKMRKKLAKTLMTYNKRQGNAPIV